MDLAKIKNYTSETYVPDIHGDPICVGDIVAVSKDNCVMVETVKKVFVKSGEFRALSNYLYSGDRSLNISKMYSIDELKEEQKNIQESLADDQAKKQESSDRSKNEKFVLGICMKPSDFGLCIFKITNNSGVKKQDITNTIQNYINQHTDEKIYVLTKDFTFVEFNQDLNNIKCGNSILFGKKNKDFQYLKRMSASEYEKLCAWKTWSNYRDTPYRIKEMFTVGSYDDGSIWEWTFPLHATGINIENMAKLVNSYIAITGNQLR